MLFVIVTGLILLMTITVSWYVSQPIVLAISVSVIGDLTGEALSILHLVQFCSIVWGPIFDGLVLFWMIASAQARDVESEVYAY